MPYQARAVLVLVVLLVLLDNLSRGLLNMRILTSTVAPGQDSPNRSCRDLLTRRPWLLPIS